MSRKYRPTKIKRSGINRAKNDKKDLNFLIRIIVILMLMFFAGRIFVTLLNPTQVNQIEIEIPKPLTQDNLNNENQHQKHEEHRDN